MAIFIMPILQKQDNEVQSDALLNGYTVIKWQRGLNVSVYNPQASAHSSMQSKIF